MSRRCESPLILGDLDPITPQPTHRRALLTHPQVRRAPLPDSTPTNFENPHHVRYDPNGPMQIQMELRRVLGVSSQERFTLRLRSIAKRAGDGVSAVMERLSVLLRTIVRLFVSGVEFAYSLLVRTLAVVFGERSARVLGVVAAMLAIGGAMYGGFSVVEPRLSAPANAILIQTNDGIAIQEGQEKREIAAVDANSVAEVAWSQDGHFVSWLTRPVETGTLLVGAAVHVYDVEREKQREIPVHELGANPTENYFQFQSAFAHQYLYVKVDKSLYQIGESGFGDWQERYVTVASAGNGFGSDSEFDASQVQIGVGSSDFLYLYGPAAQTSAYGGPSSILQLPARGAARLIATDDTANLPIGGMAISNDGSTLAFFSGWRNGLCFNSVGGVTLINVTTLSQKGLSLPTAAPGYFLGVFGIFPYGEKSGFTLSTVRIGGDCVDDAAPLVELYQVTPTGISRLVSPVQETLALMGVADDQVVVAGHVSLESGFFGAYPYGSDLSVSADGWEVDGVRRVMVELR